MEKKEHNTGKAKRIYEKYKDKLPKMVYGENNSIKTEISKGENCEDVLLCWYDGIQICIDHIDDTARLFSVDEEGQLPFTGLEYFLSHGGKLKTVVDIGAHVGTFTLSALIRGARKVYAYEPNPRTLRTLEHNISANGYWGDVFISNAGILGISSEVGGSACYSYREGATGQGSFMVKPKAKANGFNQLVAPIVSFFEEMPKVGEVSYLKMDIEGGEYSIFHKENLEALVVAFKGIECLEIEVHSSYGQPKEIYEILGLIGLKPEFNGLIWRV